MLVSVETLQAFVRGYTLGELAEQEAIRRSGLDRDQWMAAHAPYLEKIIADGHHPLVARVVLDAEVPHADPGDEPGFALGLERILDGLSANLPPRRHDVVRRGRRAGGRSQPPTSRFCQNIPSADDSNPSMSFTAIIGALVAALPVTMRRTARGRAARTRGWLSSPPARAGGPGGRDPRR